MKDKVVKIQIGDKVIEVDEAKMREEWGLTKAEAEELFDGMTFGELFEIIKAGDIEKGIAMLTRNVMKFFLKRKEEEKQAYEEVTYQFFKVYADLAGEKLDRKEASQIRTNMLLFAQKLYEIHQREEADNEN